MHRAKDGHSDVGVVEDTDARLPVVGAHQPCGVRKLVRRPEVRRVQRDRVNAPHTSASTPVYTPPELRRRGYAGALVAHLTQYLLDGERDFCFLYTALANPTTNRIYQNVGYEFVVESAEYAFDRRAYNLAPVTHEKRMASDDVLRIWL